MNIIQQIIRKSHVKVKDISKETWIDIYRINNIVKWYSPTTDEVEKIMTYVLHRYEEIAEICNNIEI
jgi:hypothetical protein